MILYPAIDLLDGRVVRRLSVVKVVVRQPGKLNRHLACYQQTMDDGRMRERNLLPSEKLIVGETPAKAVHVGRRCRDVVFPSAPSSRTAGLEE